MNCTIASDKSSGELVGEDVDRIGRGRKVDNRSDGDVLQSAHVGRHFLGPTEAVEVRRDHQPGITRVPCRTRGGQLVVIEGPVGEAGIGPGRMGIASRQCPPRGQIGDRADILIDRDAR